MPTADIKDLNIRGTKHPKYNSNRILEDRPIEFVIQKLEMILYTNKGDILGDPDFGANLEYYLWSTNVPVSKIERELINQIDTYIPELNNYDYTLNLELFEGTIRDILFINIRIKDKEVDFLIS